MGGSREFNQVGRFEKNIYSKGHVSLEDSSDSMYPGLGQLEKRDSREFNSDNDLGL